jgi:NAD(P)-dependent dehydrogenase (short-subunit alcohol dehydrogenase family)
MINLSGKTIVITGGARGLGYEIARAAAGQGASLALIGRTLSSLESAAKELTELIENRPQNIGQQITIHVADIANDDQVRDAFAAIVAAHGKVDGLVNNAGVAEEHKLLDTPPESWRRVVETNLTAPFTCMVQAARAMGPGSAIVNIASVDSRGADGPFASYVAAKTGLIGLTKAAAVELGPLGIRVVSVSPGWTMTDMVAESVTPEALHRMRTNFTRAPLGRMTEGIEVANTVVFLLSNAASGITGEDVLVDCGTTANLYILETLEEQEDTPA